MLYLLLALLLATIPAPPAVSTTVEQHSGGVTVYLLNSDARYEDFVLHVVGQPDTPVHAMPGELQSASLSLCGQFDMVAETVSDPPVLFNRYQATVPCRAFYLPLVYGAAVN